jgi:DNA-binding NtrC family response regulator
LVTEFERREKEMKEAKVIPKDNSAVKKRAQAIVACTDSEIQQLLISVLGDFGLQPILSTTLDDAKALLAQEETAMAFSQARFTEGSYREFLRAADSPSSRVPLILCSEFYDKDLYVEAMTLGAFDFLAFPYRSEEVARVVSNALAWGALPRAGHA